MDPAHASPSGYRLDAPDPDAVARLPGDVLLDFGTDWCGHCQAAAPLVAQALAARPDVRHLQVEDGRGRPLGRRYAVKLWPTLVLLRDGEEVGRVVRPHAASGARALADLLAPR